MPKGTNSRPSMPGKANSGTKTRTMIRVEYRIAERTSMVASATTLSMARVSAPVLALGPSFAVFARHSRSRRSTFSTPTTASSTSSPMAMASPPRVMVLTESPIQWNTSAVTSRATGSAVSEMKVVRRLSRNSSNTTATMIAASRSASRTLPTDAWMKSACRNRTA
jgi:hypothetical protein